MNQENRSINDAVGTAESVIVQANYVSLSSDENSQE